MANVLITGCSSGLGLAAALAFGRNGDNVIAGVRDPGRATQLAGIAQEENLRLRLCELDVTKSETFAAVIDGINNTEGGVDVLINNAGILHPGALEDLPEQAIRQVMETNFFGALLLTRAVLPQMRERGAGTIIMISSLSGLAGLAGDVTYSASKFALEGASEALRHEVDRWGIRVALVEAGGYATALFRSGNELPDYYPPSSPYRSLIESKLAAEPGSLAPEQVANLLLEIAASNKHQLRWAADDIARYVLDAVHGKSDSERDEFLKGASGSDWWSEGLDAAPEQA